jgi:pimeloyl-ACP methyl ester carboxylesterase
MACGRAKKVAGRVARTGVTVVRAGLAAGVTELLPDTPQLADLPPGEVVELPGRGRTYVVDVPGPRADSPTVVLLHALGCTAYLGWAATIEALSQDFRVVTFDQRWHGRGIRSSRFRIADCADDVAAVLDVLGIDRALMVGYSMGGAIAQETWHRHPRRVSGLVLCSTSCLWRDHLGERIFFPLVSVAMHPLGAVAMAKVEARAALLADAPVLTVVNPHRWSIDEFRSTSLWSMPEVLAEMGRFDSRRWLRDIDVPTSVVVTDRDHAVPPARQEAMAAAIPGARVFHHGGGHASIFMGHATWSPVFLDAVRDVAVRAHGPLLRVRPVSLSG